MTYNNSLYNGLLYGGTKADILNTFTDLIVFDGYSLSDNTVVTTVDLQDSMADRDVIRESIPRHHGLSINNVWERAKIIEASGTVRRDTNTLLEAELDTMRKKLTGRETYLDITKNGTTKRYIATLMNPEEVFAARKKYHITYAPFSARFLCHKGFATDRSYTSVAQSTSSASQGATFENTGTAPARVSIALNFSAAASVTEITARNSTTGVEITYTGSVSAGDIIKFDGEIMRVQKNGSNVGYSGAFPQLDPGTNDFTVDVASSSHTALITLKSKMAYR